MLPGGTEEYNENSGKVGKPAGTSRTLRMSGNNHNMMFSCSLRYDYMQVLKLVFLIIHAT